MNHISGVRDEGVIWKMKIPLYNFLCLVLVLVNNTQEDKDPFTN